MACDVNQLLADACTNRFSCLPNLRSFDVAMAQLLCEVKDAIETTIITVSGNAHGAGSPVGVVTPAYIGQIYTDTTPPYAQWNAVGATSADWIQMV